MTEDVEIRFDRGRLGHLPPVLFKRAVRIAVEALGATLDHDQTVATTSGVAGQERGSVTAEGGEVVVEWSPEHVDVRKLRPTEPFRYPLTLPGETASDEFGWQFVAFESHYDGAPATRADLDVQIARSGVKGPLYFRTVEPGDVMRPLGFDGRRKLTDILSSARLTEAARRRLPIVCDLLGPLWAPGVCLDERARPEEGVVLRLQFAPLTRQ